MMSDTEIEMLPSLEVSFAEFVRIERLPKDEAATELDELKRRAHKAYRHLVKRLHPDVNGGNAEKTSEFIAVTDLVKKIERLELGVRQEVYEADEEGSYDGYDERTSQYASASEGDFFVVQIAFDPITGVVYASVTYFSM